MSVMNDACESEFSLQWPQSELQLGKVSSSVWGHDLKPQCSCSHMTVHRVAVLYPKENYQFESVCGAHVRRINNLSWLDTGSAMGQTKLKTPDMILWN